MTALVKRRLWTVEEYYEMAAAGVLTEDERVEQYDIMRCVAAGNPAYPPTMEAKLLVEMMIEMVG